jgi:ankyrin repeat protein
MERLLKPRFSEEGGVLCFNRQQKYCYEAQKILKLLFWLLIIIHILACSTKTPLIKASTHGDINSIDVLIRNGADINERDTKWGWPPLLYAVDYNQAQAVKLLVENGANVNIMDEYGNTPLLLAMDYYNKNIIDILVDSGAITTIRNKDGYTPLTSSISDNHHDVATLLIEKGADVNVKDGRGNTPLSLALYYNEIDIAKRLIDKGADINTTNKYGSTPLMMAISSGQIELAEILIEKGANVNVIDSYGAKASDYAKSMRNPITRAAKVIDSERKEYLLKLLEDAEAKQIASNVYEIEQAACTETAIKNNSIEERERNKKIAIVPAHFLPETDVKYLANMSEIGERTLDGAGVGGKINISIALISHQPAVFLLLPAFMAVGAVTGAIVGVVKEDPEKEKLEKKKALGVDNEIKNILHKIKMQETMAQQLQETGKRITDFDFIVLKEAGPSVPEDRPNYTLIINQGIEAILEINVKKFGSEKFGGDKSKLYYFYFIVQARLVQGEELFKQEFKYVIGPPRTYSEWVNSGADALQREIDKAYEALAQDIVEFIFLYAYFEDKDYPSSRLYDSAHVTESLYKIPVSKLFNTRYILGGLAGLVLEHPAQPDTGSFLWPLSSGNIVIDTLRPTLIWEAFPTAEDFGADNKKIISHITDVTYDLRVWMVNNKSRNKLIYEKNGLKDNKHSIECSLEPASNYLWTVRARFKLDDQLRMTRWATFPRLSRREPTTGQIQGYGKDLFTGSIPVIRSFYPFMTRSR